MSRPPAPPPTLASLAELAERAGVEHTVALRLFDRAGVEPHQRGGGRGNVNLWLAVDVYLLRVLKQLASMACPDPWLIAVATWWRKADLGTMGAGRHLVVCPSREHGPVFIAPTARVGQLLAGCHAWVVDLATEITYR